MPTSKARWLLGTALVPAIALPALFWHAGRGSPLAHPLSAVPLPVLVFPGEGPLEYRRGHGDWRLWTPHVRLVEGDWLRTIDEGARAFLDAGASEIWIDPATTLRFHERSDPTRMALASGRIVQSVPETPGAAPFELLVGSISLRTAGAVFEIGQVPDEPLDVRVATGRVEIVPPPSFDIEEIEASISLDAQEGLVGYRSLQDYALLGREAPRELLAELRKEVEVRRLSEEEARSIREKLLKERTARGDDLPGEPRTEEEREIRAVIVEGRAAIVGEDYERLRALTVPEFLCQGKTFDQYLEYVLDIRDSESALIVGFHFRSLAVLATKTDALVLFRIDLDLSKGSLAAKYKKRQAVGRMMMRKDGSEWRAVEIGTEREE